MRLVVLAVLAVLVLWVVAVVLGGLAVRSDLRAAERSLGEARRAAGNLDLVAADDALLAAEARLDDARATLGRPDMALAAAVPVLGRDIRAAGAIADGAGGVAEAGARLVGALVDLGGLEALAPQAGRFPTDSLRTLAPLAREAAESIGLARSIVEAAPEPWLVSEVTTARERFLGLVTPVADEVTRLAELADVVPRLLGADGPTRYFLAAANPAEQRGTGGFLGSWTIATFSDGELELGTFQPLQALPDLPADAVPAPNPSFAARYERFGGSGLWKNLNLTPDFPSAAHAIEALWAEVTGEQLDGVIVADPFAFQALIETTGPVQIPDGPRLRPREVVDYVTNEAYADLGAGAERKEVLGEVAAVALQRFLTNVDGDGLRRSLRTIGGLLAGRHLQVHSTDDEVQAVLAALNADGALGQSPGDLLAVFVNSGANSKVDYYTERTLSYEVEFLSGGAVEGVLSAVFENTAPAGGVAGHVIGPNVEGLSAGDNQFLASIYCAPTCTFDGVTVPRGRRAVLSEELGHPVADAWVVLPRGERSEVVARWVTAQAWAADAGVVTYRLRYRDQVSIQGTRVEVGLAIPDGWVVDDAPEGAMVRDGRVSWVHADGGDRSWVVRLRPQAGDTSGLDEG